MSAALLLLLLATRGCGAVPGIFSDFTAASLILDIHKHFSTACISLLYSFDNNTGSLGRDVHRFVLSVEMSLLRQDIPSNALPLETFNYTKSWANCHRNGPLYVVLTSRESTKRALFERAPIAGPIWLVLLEHSTIDEFFQDVNIPFNCELFVAERKGPRVYLTEVYRVADGRPLTMENYGKWSMRHVYDIKYTALYDRRNNLGQHVFRAAIINNPPIISVKNTSGQMEVDGYLHHVWKILEKQLNFTVEYMLPKDPVFGAVRPDGSWSGMLGAVERREADLAIGLMASSQRVQVFAFTTPVLYLGYRVYLHKPSAKILDWANILEPFSTYLWLVAILCWAVVSCELAVVYWIGRRSGNPESHGPPVYTFPESVLCVFGALFCQQGHTSSPQSLSCRIVFLLVYCTGTVLLAAYSATLISTLATPRVSLPFSSLDDLMEDPTYRVGMAAGSALIGLFNNSNGMMNEVYKRFAADDGVLPRNYTSGLQRVCKEEKYTFMMPSEIAGEILKSKTECPIIELPKMFNKGSMGNVFEKNSPYLGIINVEMQKLRAVGILAHLRRVAWPGLVEVDVASLPSVDLKQVLPVICVLAIGLVTSITILVAELIIRWMQRWPQELPVTTHRTAPLSWSYTYARFFHRRMNMIGDLSMKKHHSLDSYYE